jgi:hypothetical protein
VDGEQCIAHAPNGGAESEGKEEDADEGEEFDILCDTLVNCIFLYL